eukprot:COSAG02_NODE_110_length_36062_cov_85.812106_28_plen_96_part_00
MLPELGGVLGPVMLGVMLDAVSFWAGALMCGGVGALAASYMVCCVKETLVKAGARGPYERVAEDDTEDEVRCNTNLLLGAQMPVRPLHVARPFLT